MIRGFAYHGLVCQVADDKARLWTYLPRQADLQRTTAGTPQLTFVELGSTAYLLLTATWAPPTADVEALRLEISRLVGADPAELRLTFDRLMQPVCRVLVAAGAGAASRPIAVSLTSQAPPYDSVFNLALRDDDLAAARAALHGEPGRLVVEYEAQRRVPLRATATFRAPGPALRERITSASDGADLRAVLEHSVQARISEVRIDSYEGDLGPITTDLYGRLLDEVALTLAHAGSMGTSDVIVTVSLERGTTETVRASADIGSIVAAQSAPVPSGGMHVAD